MLSRLGGGSYKLCGESRKVDLTGIDEKRAEIMKVIEPFGSRNTYNSDEFALWVK